VIIVATAARAGRGRRWIWLVVFGAIVVLPIAWYLGSPLFLNKTVNEAFPMKQTVTASENMPAAAEPKALSSGSFGEVDAVHKGQGTATVYRAGGALVLRLDPFQVTNGPDLYVYLSAHPAPRNSRQLHEGAALEVSRLKGNIGAQNYTLPADLDLSRYKSVVVYCRRFSVVFSTAELRPQ
jgi:hypothetical protein